MSRSDIDTSFKPVLLMFIGLLLISFVITKCDGERERPVRPYDFLADESSSYRYGYNIGYEVGRSGNDSYCHDYSHDVYDGCNAGYQAAKEDGY